MLLFFVACTPTIAQYETKLSVTLNEFKKELNIKQEFTYFNDSRYNLGILYFNDWANAYAEKDSDLAKRFAQEFKKSLHIQAGGKMIKMRISKIKDILLGKKL